MFKKLCLLLCLMALVAWAAPSKSHKASAKSKKATTEAVKPAPEAAPAAEDDGFISAADAPQTQSAADDEEEEAVDSSATLSGSQRAEYLSRKKFEEEQRLDEYANSERRRDWLKDRLIFELGMGSRMPFSGETGMGMGFGVGVEYITKWHVGAYASFGFLPKGTDNEFSDFDLEGGSGYKFGINYYLFPKNPVHLGLSVSYGTVYFDHDIIPDADGVRSLIKVNGWQFDALITYMTQEWYYLQFSVGFYYAPDLAKSKDKNPSFTESIDSSTEEEITYTSRVVNQKGMNKMDLVIGISIGYAFPEFFPDDTEKRRRERERNRAKAAN